MGGDLDDLAYAAADALVSAMVTDSWDAVRQRFAAVVGHERRMETARAELAAASSQERERERLAQARKWSTRLRDVLDDDPGLADDLRALLAEIGSDAPAAVPVSQHAHADGQSQAVNVGGNISDNAGEIYIGVGKVDKRKINIALAPFVFLARAAKKIAMAHPVPAAAATVAAVLVVATAAGWTARWPSAVFGSAAHTLSWEATEAPWPPGADANSSAGGFEGQMIAASCPAESTCLATGNYLDKADNAHTVVDTANQGTPAVAGSRMPLPPDATAQSYPLVDVMTCTAPGQCMAGGSYATSTQNGLIETLSDGAWTPVRLPLPGEAGRDNQMQIAGLACPAVNDCIAVGGNYYANSAGTMTDSRALTQTLTHGRWTPAEIPVPANAATTSDVAELEAISCTSVQTCVAVGQYTDTHGTTQGLIETLANGTWTPGEAPLPQAAPARQKAILWALACTAPGSCSAVGQYTDTHGTTQGLIETLANGRWTPAQAPLPLGASGLKTAELYGLACAGSDPCAAVGQYTDTHGTTQGLIETRAGQTWIPGQAALPHNAAGTGQNAALYTVACSVTGTCLAAGSYTDDHKHIQGLIETTAPMNIAVAAVAPPASNAAPTAAQPSASAPSPSPSNSLAASFSDGTQVLVAGGAVDGGTGNGWTEDLEIVAGPDGLPNVGSLLIQAADSNSWEASGSPEFYYGYAAPGSGVTNEPPLPANPTNEDVPPPAELAPGSSICVTQDFQNANVSSGDNDGPEGYSVTATLANGANETVSLPSDGSGPGDACLFTG